MSTLYHVTCQLYVHTHSHMSHVHTVPCDMSHLCVTVVCQKDLVLGDVDLAT